MLLPLLILFPFIGGLVTYALSRRDQGKAEVLGLTTAIVELFLALGYLSRFLSGGDTTHEYSGWLKNFHVKFTLGLDGLSAAMVILTAIIFAASSFAAWGKINFRQGTFFSLFLFMEAGLMGVFTSFNLFVFYVFWEIVLVPAFVLIGIFGGERRTYAAFKVFIYTHLGSLFMLLGFLALYFSANSFNIIDINTMNRVLPEGVKTLAFGLMFIGFAFKIPLVPFHSWLPDAYTQSPSPVSMVLAGVISKMGAYGLLRLGITLLPDTFAAYAAPIAFLALLTVFYAALSALAQRDIKSLVAFSSLSHMGFITLGIASLSFLGLNGAAFQMVSHGLIIALLFFLIGILRKSTGTSMISQLKGFTYKFPFLGWFIVFASLASLGLPGLSGFVGELNIILGAYESASLLAYIAILSLPLTAGYYLWMLQRSAFGSPNARVEGSTLCIRGGEAFAVMALALLIAYLGIYPASLMEILSTTSERLLELGGI